MKRAFTDFETALMLERIVSRVAGYSGWSPAENEDGPDSSELWEEALKPLPLSAQKHLDHSVHTQEDSDRDSATSSRQGDFPLSDKSGLALKVSVIWSGDADEDGPSTHKTENIEYTMWCGNKEFGGHNDKTIKQEIHKFTAYLEHYDPTGYAALTGRNA